MSKIINLEKKKADGNIVTQGKLEVKNATADSADLYIYGYITSYKWDKTDVVPEDVKELLDSVKDTKNLNIYINSGGGSVFAGMAIHNMIKRMTAYKTVYVDGIAASIASVIAFSGDKIVIPSNAYLMIHNAWIITDGNADDLREMADVMDKIDEGIVNVYQERAKDGVDREMIQELMRDETWFTGLDAGDYFDVELANETKAVAYSRTDGYKNIPENVVSYNNNHIKRLKAKMKLACEY